MKKSFKSLLSCLLIIMMLFSSTSMVFALGTTLPNKSYVALGDSISFGLSDINGGYTALFRDYLGSGYSYNNLSVPGYTTTDLINIISNNKSLIKNASIITISIGGNNLLGPFMQSVASLYGLKLSDYSSPDGSDFLRALESQIKDEILRNGNPVNTFSQLMDQNNPYARSLNQALLVGLTKFNIEFPLIIAKVKLLAPKAKIYVNTIYNPGMKAGAGDPMAPFYQKMDKLIQSMNKAIKAYSPIMRYKCVDVYTAFASSNLDVLSFNIPLAIINFNDEYLFRQFCDPHPTTIGHRVIYETLLKLQ